MGPQDVLKTNAEGTVQPRYWVWTALTIIILFSIAFVGTITLDIAQALQTIVLLGTLVGALAFGRWIGRRADPELLGRDVYELPASATVKRSQTTNSALEYRYHITIETDDTVWSYTGFKGPTDRAIRITEWSSAPTRFGTHTRDRTTYDTYTFVNPTADPVHLTSSLHETPRY